MYLTSSTLASLLALLPKGGVAAEIGVFKGETTASFLRDCAPSRLHLIDPWEEQTGAYRFDALNAPQAQQDQLFAHVSRTFAGEIATGRVVLHRDYSERLAPSFPDHYFDWIYIDGNHTYDAVFSDLRLYAPKMKDTGLILGDDFINGKFYLKMKFGVVEAVQDFVRSRGYDFLLLTQDWRYILSKPGNPMAVAFLRRLLATAPFAVEIAGLEKMNYTTKAVLLSKDRARFLHSFR